MPYIDQTWRQAACQATVLRHSDWTPYAVAGGFRPDTHTQRENLAVFSLQPEGTVRAAALHALTQAAAEGILIRTLCRQAAASAAQQRTVARCSAPHAAPSSGSVAARWQRGASVLENSDVSPVQCCGGGKRHRQTRSSALYAARILDAAPFWRRGVLFYCSRQRSGVFMRAALHARRESVDG